MLKYIIFIFKEKNLFFVILAVLIHQMLIASSIIFLTKLLLAYQTKSNYSSYLFLYLASMVLPYIPGLLSYSFLQKLINSAHYKYLMLVINNKNIKLLNYRDTKNKEKISSIISRSSFSIISSLLYFTHDLFTLLCNSLLSFIIIYYILPFKIAFGYIITSILSFIIIFTTKRMIENKSINVENSLIEYSNILSKLPDNISTGNSYNSNGIFNKIRKEGKIYYKNSLNLQNTKQLINFILAMVALLPTCYLIIFTINSVNINNSNIIAVIIVNITRIFTLLSSLNTLLNSFIDLPSLIGRMKILLNILDTKNTVPSKISGFFINKVFFNDTQKMYSFLTSNEHGRFTITGDNGSGKSTFLHELKIKLGNQAIIIPTNISNLYWNNQGSFEDLSSGQRIKKILETSLNGSENFILLDEWNANLDSINTDKLNDIINQVSKSKVVIEIVHRH